MALVNVVIDALASLNNTSIIPIALLIKPGSVILSFGDIIWIHAMKSAIYIEIII